MGVDVFPQNIPSVPLCRIFDIENYGTGACKVLENVPSAFYIECVVQVKRDNDGRIVDDELTLRAAIQHQEQAPVPQDELDSEEHGTRHGHYVIV